MMNCDCQDWQRVVHEHKELFQEHSEYGWVITWIELSKEGAYHRTNRYGMQIQYCPFCGNKLQ